MIQTVPKKKLHLEWWDRDQKTAAQQKQSYDFNDEKDALQFLLTAIESLYLEQRWLDRLTRDNGTWKSK